VTATEASGRPQTKIVINSGLACSFSIAILDALSFWARHVP